MKTIGVTLWAESLKVRKSKIFWLSMIFFVFVSSMMALIMFVQMHPEIAEKLGMIGTKASLMKFGEPNWQNYLTLVLQGMGGIGLVGFGFITSWMFGREYTENTIKDILALPVSRLSIIISKFIVIIFWCIILTCIFLGFGFIFGYLAGFSNLTAEVFLSFLHAYFLISFLTILLCTPIAFFASYSKGFLLPFGVIVLIMIIANFSGLVGLGPYFPWSIPGVLTVPPGHLQIVSYVIVFSTSIIGFLGTSAWWQYADQK